MDQVKVKIFSYPLGYLAYSSRLIGEVIARELSAGTANTHEYHSGKPEGYFKEVEEAIATI